MTSKAKMEAEAELHMDRRIIRVDCLPDQAGIAAALRRAFAAGPTDPSDADQMFDDLLRRLN